MKITPQNIMDFTSVNVITTPTNIDSATIPYSDPPNKLVWAHLIPAFPAVLAGGQGAVYALEFLTANQANADPDAFLIYWVEYQANGAGTATWLGDRAPLMFTALMSGCSFGLGSYTPNGVRAAHVNSASASQTGTPDNAQKDDQHQKLLALQLTTKVITIDQYLPGQFDQQVKSTPFGYRPQLKGGNVPVRGGIGHVPTMSLPWKFCWLKYRAQGKNFTHMGVAQHAGGLF